MEKVFAVSHIEQAKNGDLQRGFWQRGGTDDHNDRTDRSDAA